MTKYAQAILSFLNKYYETTAFEENNKVKISELLDNINKFYHYSGYQICNHWCLVEDIKSSTKYAEVIITDDYIFGLKPRETPLQ